MTPTPPAVEPAHHAYIDALRGWAFLGVLAVHVGQRVGAFPGKAVVAAGQQGVTLFFVASALTLALSARSRTRAERHPTRNYFVRRFFRIAPLFWTGIVAYVFLRGPGPQFWAPDGVRATDYALTAAFLHGWHPRAANGVVPGGWSIGVEMTFYLLVPFLLGRLTSLTRTLAALLAAVPVSLALGAAVTRALAPVTPASERYLLDLFAFYWFPSQFPVFLCGFALFFLVNDGRVMAALRAGGGHGAGLLLAGSLYGLVALAFGAGGGPFAPPHVAFGIVLAGFALALAAVPNRLFVNGATRRVGVVSFSAYLCHFAVVDVLAERLPTVWPRLGPAGEAVRFAALFAASLTGTLVVSAVTYRWIEHPGMALGRKWIRRWEEPAPRTSRLGLPATPGGHDAGSTEISMGKGLAGRRDDG